MPAGLSRSLKTAVVTGLVVALIPGAALAGKPTAGSGTSTSGLTLSSESYSASRAGGVGCYGEDSYHDRTWTGSLGGGASFNIDLPFCTYGQAPAGPGGSAFLFRASGKGTFTFKATSPSGASYVAHVEAGTKGSSQQARCIVPPSTSPTSGIIMGTIEEGNWRVSLTNPNSTSASSVSLRVYVAMAKVSWQQNNCPQVDWNFD